MINNNIKEPKCSFVVSKLLKEKGFNIDTYTGWLLMHNEYHWNSRMFTYDIWQPTHSLAIEWIRINFGIIIHSYPRTYNETDLMWSYSICRQYHDGHLVDGLEFPDIQDPNKIPIWSNPNDSTEAALIYVLSNLI
jgi:hypothetical protein